MSKASEDLPDPLRPVTTVSRLRGMRTVTFRRLCSRAPATRMQSLFMHQATRTRWYDFLPDRRISTRPSTTSAPDTVLYDPFPAGVTYNDDAQSSAGDLISGTTGLTWTGEIGFDASVYITFSVTTDPTYTGRLTNTAFVTQSTISDPLSSAS